MNAYTTYSGDIVQLSLMTAGGDNPAYFNVDIYNAFALMNAGVNLYDDVYGSDQEYDASMLVQYNDIVEIVGSGCIELTKFISDVFYQ